MTILISLFLGVTYAGTQTSMRFAEETLVGDVNHDGKVNIGDIISVCNFMAGDETITLDDADVNKDGKADIGDIITIANIMAGNNDNE